MNEAVGVASIAILFLLFLAVASKNKNRHRGGLATGNTSEPPPKPKPPDADWWCPTCQEWVDGGNVSHEENHDTCGKMVFGYKCACADLPDPEENIKELLEVVRKLAKSDCCLAPPGVNCQHRKAQALIEKIEKKQCPQ